MVQSLSPAPDYEHVEGAGPQHQHLVGEAGDGAVHRHLPRQGQGRGYITPCGQTLEKLGLVHQPGVKDTCRGYLNCLRVTRAK